ncbi:HAD family hydrolase [Amycolatopsis sp. cg5]|uniref:HAD family hydrolase n=1 Tax=Amycolatopsis sp. cg5 TaxID=3238802 RepID=UPI003523F969
MAGKVQLITVDIGRTLGTFTGTSTAERLRALSPLADIAPHRFAETVRCLLHRAPELTSELVSQVCRRLLIPFTEFPTRWDRGYLPYPHAARALDELARIAPVVALSNMAVTGGPERVSAVRRAHLGELAAIYPSFQLGGAKPEPWLWQAIAGRHGTEVEGVVHIGDRLDADVYGALYAGARVVHIRHSGEATVYPKGSGDKVFTVFDLLDAVPVVQAWSDR